MPQHPTREDRPQGETVPVQGEKQQRVPRQPHERDESAASQAPEAASNQRIGKIAHDDVEEGQRDTDKGPVLDRTYEDLRKDDPTPHRG
jgi:hypothetical protein